MKKALGKGLSALIPDTYIKKAQTELAPEASAEKWPLHPQIDNPKTGFRLIPVTEIKANHDQPRQTFSPEAIEELAASIREKGVLQPVVVKEREDGQYEIICGERRLRAAILCGLTEIPAIVKDIAPDDFLEWALIENVQREDLNPIEEAQAYRRLAEERMLSQDEIAKRVGKSRVAVTNTLRLLRLPAEVIEWVASERLTAGHARNLLSLPTPEHQRQMAKRIVEDGLSVRQVELIVNRSNAHRRKPKSARMLKPEIVDLEHRLVQYFGTQVKIYPRKNMQQGRIELHYFSLDDLDRILKKFALPEMP